MIALKINPYDKTVKKIEINNFQNEDMLNDIIGCEDIHCSFLECGYVVIRDEKMRDRGIREGFMLSSSSEDFAGICLVFCYSERKIYDFSGSEEEFLSGLTWKNYHWTIWR